MSESPKTTQSGSMAERRFPIRGGPSVPWSVMAPHEWQAQKNHGQSLERLAKRGGLDPAEAWAILTGNPWPRGKTQQDEWAAQWRAFATRIGGIEQRCDRYREALESILVLSGDETATRMAAEAMK